MDLPIDEQWIDDFAAIIDRDVLDDLRLARIFIDLDDADVRAERKREILWLEKVSGRQSGFGVRRNFLGDMRGQRDLLDRQTRSAFSLRLGQSSGGRLA